jgi:serine/threonine-protein phosphatase 5
MTSLDIEAATALKQQGNKAFTKHDWLAAVDFYTQAIEKYDHDPSFFSNRAQAHIKLESYGYAIADATKALELDPSYTKAYWRRALANTAILNPKEALKDFKSVVRKEPNNRDAKLKLAECEKLVRRIEFEKAIEVGEPPSAFEDLNIDGINVEDSYDGVRLGTEMTSEFIDDMIERFRNGKKIHRKYVFQIVKAVLEIVKAGPTMVEIEVENSSKLTVCGDTHGQFFDLLEIFRLNGYPSETHAYLFNGDFVDRGSWSTEIALLLYAYKWLRPDRFFLNRGNHETDGMNRIYGFEGECKAKYNESVYKVFTESFAALPLATLIGRKYLVLHGGLFSDDNITLDDIRKLNRQNQPQPGQSGLMMEMLWTDPQPVAGRAPSKRGMGLLFGPDVTKRFCEKNGLEAIIRSHEVRMNGYEVEHDGRCITVFSAPKYCDTTENKGAFINLGSELKLEYQVFEAVPHPDIKPMAYAQNSLLSMM